MLACSFCLNVPPPSWWSSPVPAPVVLAALVGAVIGFVALDRAQGRRRTGGILVAVGLSVALPLAALSVDAGRTRIDVVTDDRPMDAPAWRVTCAAALQQPREDEFVSACRDATSAWRGTAIGLAAASAVLVLVGSTMAARKDRSSGVDVSADDIRQA